MSNMNRQHVNAPQTFNPNPPKPTSTTPAPAYLRDEIAMAALTGLLSSAATRPSNHEWTAQESYLFADAMLAARDAT